MRNLHRLQAGQGVNAPGIPEIPPSVFEELLVNALIHRDYLVNATIRVFIFDNRIEIISPGNLPNNLTVEKIRSGISNIRNPILVSYIAKGLLPYRGLGSGIKRALDNWPDIDFSDDREGCVFIATVHRKELKGSAEPGICIDERSEKSSEKSSEKILSLLKSDPGLAAGDIAKMIGITQRAVEKQIAKLREEGRIRRIGPDKGGHWEVVP
jgi:ATP-dependent DNA helicase RecG